MPTIEQQLVLLYARSCIKETRKREKLMIGAESHILHSPIYEQLDNLHFLLNDIMKYLRLLRHSIILFFYILSYLINNFN